MADEPVQFTLWSDELHERYTKRKAKELTEYLSDKRLMDEDGDDGWALLDTLYKPLTLDEHTTFGIIMYLYLFTNDVEFGRVEPSGLIRIRARW